MRLCIGRRLVVLLVIMLLILGSAAQSIMAADMDMAMPGASSSMEVPHHCDACGDDEAMPELVCHSSCGSSVAVLTNSIAPNLGLPSQLNASVAAGGTSWRTTPDPYPPRSVVLS